MAKNTVLLVLIALLSGFIAGFLLANSMNRSEMNALRAGSTFSAVGEPSSTDSSQPNLSAEEIMAKIAEADQNPQNFSFQRDLGLALYRFAAMQGDPDLLAESARLLERANKLQPRDFDVIVGLGNARFDIGFFQKDLKSFEAARQIYAQALAIRPSDPDVATDVGISYFVQEPPDYDRAERELARVSAANPTHQRSLQFLVQAQAKLGKTSEAARSLERLRAINPTNPVISELEMQVSGTAPAR
jgi:tetratricopeptide (TPR) repeat protein